MRKMTIVAMVMIMAIASAACPGKGEHGRKGKRMGKGHGGDHFQMLIHKGKETLGLTDQQVEKIKSLRKNHRKAMVKKEADLKLTKIELEEALHGDNISKSKADALVDKMMKIQAEMKKSSIHLRIDVHKTLTKEQREKMKAMKMGKGRRGKRGCKGEHAQKGECKHGGEKAVHK